MSITKQAPETARAQKPLWKAVKNATLIYYSDVRRKGMIMVPEMDVTGSGRYEPHAGRE